jgi:hypothetical protein
MWGPSSNKKYTWNDVDIMVHALPQFFWDSRGNCLREQLRAAEDAYMNAVKQPDVSPLKAFQDIVMTTAFAQQRDTLYGSHGGLVYYLTNTWPRVFGEHSRELSPALHAECQKAKSLRKMEEIKKLMANNNSEDNMGGVATEARQAPDAVGQDIEAEATESGGNEEEKKDGSAEATAETSPGEAWVVVDGQDSNTPQSD